MTKLERVLYTAKAHTTGGRDGGASRTDDGRLQITLSQPGTSGTGTNPCCWRAGLVRIEVGEDRLFGARVARALENPHVPAFPGSVLPKDDRQFRMERDGLSGSTTQTRQPT